MKKTIIISSLLAAAIGGLIFFNGAPSLVKVTITPLGLGKFSVKIGSSDAVGLRDDGRAVSISGISVAIVKGLQAEYAVAINAASKMVDVWYNNSLIAKNLRSGTTDLK